MAAQRGSNYSTEEDVCIARAYVQVSTDPISGSEQRQITYYGRIYIAYKQKKPADAPLRSESSVESRVKDIQKQCVRFSGCFASIKALKRSGVNEDDEICLATALFNKRKVQHPNEDIGKRFKYLEAWEVLRALPKYSAAGEASPSNTESGTTTGLGSTAASGKEGGTESPAKSGGDRPMGRKRAKEVRIKEEQQNKKLRLAESALELQKKQVKELEEHNLILLFTNGPGGTESELAREFFTMRQKAVLEKMRSEQKKEEESAMNVLAEVATDTIDDVEE